MSTLKQGDRVRVTYYGEPRTGTVEYVRSLVFVRFDDTGRVQWFHKESVTLLDVEANT